MLNDEKLSKDTGSMPNSAETRPAPPELDGDIEDSSGKTENVNIESLRDKLKKPKKAEKRVHEEDEIILGKDAK